MGMQTMVEAGMDPHAALVMFECMLQASRYSGGERIPEFLCIHPLSESCIVDTRNRVRKYSKQIRETKLDYQLMWARVVNQLADIPEEAV